MKGLILGALFSVFIATGSPAEDLSVYHIGNSVTDTIHYDRMVALARAHGDTYRYGRHTIPGAPLSWIQDHPDGGFSTEAHGPYVKALPGFQWDAITLQPFDRQLSGPDGDIEVGSGMIRLALQNPENAKTRFLVYSRWPRRDSETASTFYGRSYREQWERSYTEPSWDGGNETREYFENVLLGWREKFPSLTIDLVPVGDVLAALSDQIDEGKLKGIESIADFYTDGIHFDDGGPAGNVGSYTVALTFYATLFKKSPVGDASYGLWGIKDPDLARQIQQTVWDVVAGHPYSGVPKA